MDRHITNIRITLHHGTFNDASVTSTISSHAAILARFPRARITLWFSSALLCHGSLIGVRGDQHIFEKMVITPALEDMCATTRTLIGAGCRVWLVMDDNVLFRSDMGEEISVDGLMRRIWEIRNIWEGFLFGRN